MEEGKDALSRMQDKLYSRSAGDEIHPRQGLSREPFEPGVSWTEDPTASYQDIPMPYPKARSSVSLTMFFFGALLFFFVCVGVAAYTFIYGGNTVSSANINLTVLGPSMVDGGKESSFQITVENKNAAALTLVDLLIEYPEGTRSATDQKLALPSERISLGTIAPGASFKQTVRAVLFGSEGSSGTIRATLEYHVEGSNAVFVKEAETNLIIGSSPVAVVVKAPDEVVSGQPVTFEVSVRSNSQTTIKNVSLEGQYPFGFSVTNSSPEAAQGDTLWQLGDLEPGQEKIVKITGVLGGQDNEERVFRFLVGSLSDKTDVHIVVPYLIVPHALTIKRPFIGADMALNGDQGKVVVVSAGSTVEGRITWTNNLDVAIQDLVIEASLTGSSLDRASVTASRGFYRSLDSTILWSRDEDGSFASVAPGATGVVEFSFTPKSSAGVNPQIGVSVSVKAKRPSIGNLPEEITSGFTRTVKVGSAVSVSAATQHFSGLIQNSGPMPPSVDQETTYTISLSARNPSNTISGTKVTTTLPSYVRYLGSPTPSTASIVYDERSRVVTWNVGDLKAGAGYSSAAQSVSFKVSLTPSLSQVGNRPSLTGAVSLSGDDRFTGAKASASADAPSTDIFGEAGFEAGMEQVVK